MRKLILGIVYICLAVVSFNANAAVIFNDLHVQHGDIYSSYIDIGFDSTIYQDGKYTINSPSSVFTDIQYGGRIDSFLSLQVKVNVIGDAATLLATFWGGRDSSGSSVSGDLNTIKNYNGWDIGNDNTSYNFSYSVAPSVPEVPIPAAAGLFGSGILGLVAVARRKANA